MLCQCDGDVQYERGYRAGYDRKTAEVSAASLFPDVFVLVDHRHEPDQLVDLRLFWDRRIAEQEAEHMRQEVGCAATAIEVKQLRWIP